MNIQAKELEAALRRIKELEDQVKELEDQVKELGKLVDRDTLITAILNRRGVEGRLAPMLEEAFLVSDKRLGVPPTQRICVVYCDIDRFKEVNDFYGHPSGDEVLLYFASMMKRRVRKTDLVGRFGGDEFVVVFLNSAPREAENKMTEIAEEFAGHGFPFDEEARLSVSFGIACAQEFNEMSTLIAGAELRMRNAKGSKAR